MHAIAYVAKHFPTNPPSKPVAVAIAVAVAAEVASLDGPLQKELGGVLEKVVDQEEARTA